MNKSHDLTLLKNKAEEIARRAETLMKRQNTTQSALETIEQPQQYRLAHYTSLEAIVSMLQSSDGGLRLFDSSTMNDPEEGRTTSDGRAILHQLNEEFGKDSWPWKRYGSANICCFVGITQKEDKGIEVGDDLLFWRLYGNECRGVSIAIAAHKSTELVSTSVIQRVMYTDEPAMQVDVASISALLKDLDRLRSQARDAGVWSEICQVVLPKCDLLLGQRFLHK